MVQLLEAKQSQDWKAIASSLSKELSENAVARSAYLHPARSRRLQIARYR